MLDLYHRFMRPEQRDEKAWHHLEPAELERFLRGELGRADMRRVVRHLLTRCPLCQATARPLWGHSPR